MVTMPHIDRDIWHRVQVDKWKYRPRLVVPRLIELHATRSGIPGRTALQEYGSTINWAMSKTNKNYRPGDTWASMESFVCGGGQVGRVLDDGMYPHYGLGHADHEAFAIEIGQNLNTTPFEEVDLDNAAHICAFLCETYDIPPKVLPYLSADNHEAPGMVRHDRSANGRYLVKSDPGDLFDDREFEDRVRAYLEPELPEEEDPMIYKTAAHGNPYMLYIVAWLPMDDGPPIPWSKRHVQTQATAKRAIKTYGEPKMFSKEELAKVPTIS